AFHEFRPVGPWHEAKEDLRARFGGDGVPHFRLSAPTRSLLVGRSIIIVGMHLDGEFVIGENEFNKDGKIVWLFESCSAPLWRHLSPRFSQGLTGKGAGRNSAIDTGQPNFANRLWQICFLREKRRERAHSPDALYKFRLNAKRLGIHGLGGGFRARKE